MKIDVNPNNEKEEFITGLAINPSGAIYLLDPGGWFPIQAEYYAVGSGAEVALGAFHFGASVEAAIYATIENNAFCGGNVMVLEL